MSDPAGAPAPTVAAAVPSASAPASPEPTKAPAKPRRRRRLLVAAAALLLLVAFHVPLLRGLAWFLSSEDELRTADAALILYGDGRYAEAARLYREQWVKRILVMQERPRRLEVLGIRPTSGAEAKRELPRLGVLEDAIEVLSHSGIHDWNNARCLRDWMAAHPQQRLVVLHDRPAGRALRMVYQSVLPPEAAARLCWRGLANEEFDESDWWLQRKGVPQILSRYTGLIYGWLYGEDETWRIWDPDEYARTLPRPAK